MEEIQDRVESERRYRVLLRALARGEAPPSDLQTLLAALGRRPAELERDLAAWRERARLAARAERVVDLMDRVAIAREGYLLVRQSALRARQEAEESEARARASYEAVARQMESARSADLELKELVHPQLRARWEAAEQAVRARRDALRGLRLSLRNAEHAEADLETAEAALDAIRREALEL